MSARLSSDAWAMALTEVYAEQSKDESTKLGAVVMRNGIQLSGGYNSFPRGVDDCVAARQKRPLKYSWFVHAEANAVYNAARIGVKLEGGSMYCRWLPCPNCAMAIIQAGLIEVVVSSFTVPERWQGDMKVAMNMLHEARVWVRVVDYRRVMPSMVFDAEWMQ